jgi:hypothetical protein
MKKLAIAVTAMFVLGLSALAYAQVTNSYTVTGSTSPTRSGTSKKPVAVSVKFGFDVGEVGGNRPSPIRKYSIRFAGLRVNSAAAPTCRSGRKPDDCPSRSIVGTGFIRNATGARNNPADKSIACNAALSVINNGRNKATIYVEGDPNQSDARKRCAIELAAPIPARFIRSSGGRAVTLEFTVPQSLLHPLPTLDNAVTHVDSSIKKVTRKRNGKTQGFFESTGGCVNGKRNITVRFTPESGTPGTAQRLASCKR